jgi:hypothetical protein
MDNNVSEEFAESIFRVLEEMYDAHKKCWNYKVEEQESGWSSRPMRLSLTCTMGRAKGGTGKNDKKRSDKRVFRVHER